MTREEAIKIIESNCSSGSKLREACAMFIPELKESEDERIRKELIQYLKDYPTNLPNGQYTRADFFAYLEKQKEQKPIIQDVELNDAVYDYVRDHFIAGADFTPEYIKKLMENAFFAGVDYYLLKQESESCEPDTNVEKVIENVILVYEKTQGGWVGGYDVDTLIVNLRRAFNKKEQKPAEWSEEDKGNLLDVKCIIDEIWHNQHDREEIDHSGEELESLWYWLDNIWQKVAYPQSHWKPSEEQMGALNYAYCELFKRKDVGHNILGPLQNLIDTLSKL